MKAYILDHLNKDKSVQRHNIIYYLKGYANFFSVYYLPPS